MRTLEFRSVKAYEVLYEGLLASKCSGVAARTLSRVFEKLEKIGVSKDETFFYTLADSTPIKLEEVEYKLVLQLLDNIEWNGIGAREAGRLLAWLDEIPFEA